MRTATIACLVICGLLGCDKSKDNQTALIASSPVATQAVPAAPPVVTAVAVADSTAIPTQEDYETAAEAAITPSNVIQELDRLQKEIGQ